MTSQEIHSCKGCPMRVVCNWLIVAVILVTTACVWGFFDLKREAREECMVLVERETRVLRMINMHLIGVLNKDQLKDYLKWSGKRRDEMMEEWKNCCTEGE